MSSYSPKDRPVTRKPMKEVTGGRRIDGVPVVLSDRIQPIKFVGTKTGRLTSVNKPRSPYDYTPMPLAHLIDRLRHGLSVFSYKHCFRGTPLKIAASRLEAVEAILLDPEYSDRTKIGLAIQALHLN